MSGVKKEDGDYAPIDLSKFLPDIAIPADIYLFIGGKYLKYKQCGDILDGDKHNQLLSKNVSSLYVKSEDKEATYTWILEEKQKGIDQIVEKVGEENRDVVEKAEELKEYMFQTFIDEDLDSEKVDILKDNVENFIAQVREKNEVQLVLARMVKHNRSIADHSLNVAHVASFIAMTLGHAHQFVLENVYMGAIFHDYAKIKIPEKVLENPSNSLYSQAIQDHPRKAAAQIRKIESVPEQVVTIVAQHHEQFNGKGYPNGLAGDEIYSLSQIVALANYFDNVCVENNKKDERDMYRTAIKAIEYDRGKRFNPENLDRIVEALKLAYGGYTR